MLHCRLAVYSYSHQGLSHLSVYINTNSLLMPTKALTGLSCLERERSGDALARTLKAPQYTDRLPEWKKISHNNITTPCVWASDLQSLNSCKCLEWGGAVLKMQFTHTCTHTRRQTHTPAGIDALKISEEKEFWGGELSEEWWSKASVGLKTCQDRKCNNSSGGIGD